MNKGLEMKKSFSLLLVTATTLLLTFQAEAKQFSSQYCSFELPPGWECALEGTEWVCQSTNAERKKEAIIILAAKIRGGQDSLEQYQAYLKDTKTFTLPGGKTQVSEPKYANATEVNGQRWVDALHLASEVPGFYTRYLATVKEDLGVAVTFSVAKDHYDAYKGVFDSIIQSLRVFRQNQANVDNFQLKNKDTNLLDSDTFIPDSDQKFDISQQKNKKTDGGGGMGTGMILAILGAGGVGFVIMKRKKKS